MSRFILERCRELHEEMECLEKSIALLFSKLKQGSKGSLLIEIVIKFLAQKMQKNASDILSIYSDSSGKRRSEISFLGGISNNDKSNGNSTSTSKDDVWQNYYERIRSIKASDKDLNSLIEPKLTKKNICQKIIENMINDVFTSDILNLMFTPEEDYGNRLDMHHLYIQFINIKKIHYYKINNTKSYNLNNDDTEILPLSSTKKAINKTFESIDYVTYLGSFEKFSSVSRFCKYRNNEYEYYISKLLEYLEQFFIKTHPLIDSIKVRSRFESEFESKWLDNSIPEWCTPSHKMKLYSIFTDSLFSSEGIYSSHIQGKKYKREKMKYLSSSIEEQNMRIQNSIAYDKSMAKTEFLIGKYCILLNVERNNTIDYLHNTQSRTVREFTEKLDHFNVIEFINNILSTENIQDEEDKVLDSDEDIDELEENIHNPLGLPVGLDGKPVPYWLFKLHGLGIEFKCEICGNYSYWGRRAFERHFQEFRHSNGLRTLGIPNTSHFKEITKIKDAQKLYEKLSRNAEANTFNEQEIEMEDTKGNILSLKSYQDLRHQGLI
ncbi:hypothetical protein cand_018480 [Cryptosporidium andersoni]|uniref:Matrin-type domain-containing protein n=1 Tax=Cryptosporidium andersoni TaxID=117008 RepID=A0A1J4M9W2_9CRYT|nr:hypothetical protein cand_018480 [Cryptosporidium andersoni]